MSDKVVEQLYGFLSKLSPDILSRCLEPGADFTGITNVANLLFGELQKQLEQLLSPAGIVASAGVDGLSPKGAILLLRCCISLLQLLMFDLSLVVEKCEILLAVLRRLHSRDLSGTGPTGNTMLPPFSTAVLEVFIEGFLVHPQLQRLFMVTDKVSCTTEKLFASSGSDGDLYVIQEIISSYFLLSVYNDWTFNRFINSLFWSKEANSEIPEISMDAALTLLGAGIMFSLPSILQAHLILLASRCIGIQSPKNSWRLDKVALSRSILAFECSVNLYLGYLSTLDSVDNFTGGKGHSTYCAKQLPFGSCIQVVACSKLDYQIEKLVSFCQSHSHDELSGNEADVLSNSVAYIKENQHIIHEKFRQETSFILECMISSFLSQEIGNSKLHENGDAIPQEMICLAAALKLMSASLLQILSDLREIRCLRGRKTSKDGDLFKAFDFISGIVRRFEKYESKQIVQKNFIDVLGKGPFRHKESMLMLSHFASLLVYSFRMRLGFLQKGCIFMMMTLMNLIIFEENSLDAFSLFLSNWKYTVHCASPQQENPMGLFTRSSVIIASNMQKLQKLYLRDEFKCLIYEDQRIEVQSRESTLSLAAAEDVEMHPSCTNEAEICNGQVLIECFPEFNRDPSEWDDVVDFIECKRGKDYSSWLKKKQRFRQWHKKKKLEKDKGKRKWKQVHLN
ncbi:uncharacterized protein [Typha latifolia]|uniref:uncharacterized protein isoform X1 n=1 Tax=Typha latifolia TaxID=4733 RepID=UPI003C2BD554